MFVYLGGIVFVSLQAYMGETNHCLNKLDCLTLPNSWLGGEGFTSRKTSHFHFLFFTTFLWDNEIAKFIEFSSVFFAKISFPLFKIDLGIIACFRNSPPFYQ